MTMTTHLNWNGIAVTAREREGAAEGLELATEHLLQVSRTRVPLEEGTLERSGTASVDRSALKGAVSYDTVYACRQHEELTWRHTQGRTAKYLEEPLLEESETLQGLIAAAIRRALR